MSIIGLFPRSGFSTVATDKFSFEFLPYGLFPFRSIRQHGVFQWRGSKTVAFAAVLNLVAELSRRGDNIVIFI